MSQRHRLGIGAVWAYAILATGVPAAESGVGFLIPRAAAERMDAECDMAAEVAERLTAATVIVPDAKGRFVDRQGRDVPLERLRVVWCYDGVPAQPQAPAFEPQTVAALRQFVRQGRGLWLAGGAAALVEPLELDPLRAPPVRTQQDCVAAGLTPIATGHPAFGGLDLEQGLLWLSNAAFPAFTEFRGTSQPAKGMILAQCPGPPSCPLVEYEAGKGRVVALGWRLDPLYGHAPASYRRNFEQLAANVVRYLGEPPRWRAWEGKPEPGGPLLPWRSLELAIRDLRETFGAQYPRGDEFLTRLEALKKNPAGADGAIAREFEQLKAEALLANPLLDFSQLLFVKRDIKQLGLPANYLGNCSLPRTGYDNEIASLSLNSVR